MEHLGNPNSGFVKGKKPLIFSSKVLHAALLAALLAATASAAFLRVSLRPLSLLPTPSRVLRLFLPALSETALEVVPAAHVACVCSPDLSDAALQHVSSPLSAQPSPAQNKRI